MYTSLEIVSNSKTLLNRQTEFENMYKYFTEKISPYQEIYWMRRLHYTVMDTLMRVYYDFARDFDVTQSFFFSKLRKEETFLRSIRSSVPKVDLMFQHACSYLYKSLRRVFSLGLLVPEGNLYESLNRGSKVISEITLGMIVCPITCPSFTHFAIFPKITWSIYMIFGIKTLIQKWYKLLINSVHPVH